MGADGEGEASVADAAAAPEGEAVEAEAEGKDGEKKMQKRKVALFLAYIGSEYQVQLPSLPSRLRSRSFALCNVPSPFMPRNRCMHVG